MRRQPNAFTLVELLVVILIVALLVAIILPSFFTARTQARMVICQGNMHRIGSNFSLAKQEPGKVVDPVLVFPIWYQWPYNSMKAMGSDAIFLCPEDTIEANTPLEHLGLRVEYRSTYGGGVAIPLTGPNVNNRFCLSRTGEDAVDGPYVEWVFEEAGCITQNFWNWGTHNDGWLRLFRDGRLKIMSCNCGGDNQLWIDNKPAFGPDPRNHMHTQIQRHVGETLFTDLGVTGMTSYGVNTYASQYTAGSAVVALLDYEDHYADPDAAVVTTMRDLLSRSARHGGKLNVLMGDASVRVRTVLELDPVSQRQAWNPQGFLTDGRN